MHNFYPDDEMNDETRRYIEWRRSNYGSVFVTPPDEIKAILPQVHLDVVAKYLGAEIPDEFREVALVATDNEIIAIMKAACLRADVELLDYSFVATRYFMHIRTERGTRIVECSRLKYGTKLEVEKQINSAVTDWTKKP